MQGTAARTRPPLRLLGAALVALLAIGTQCPAVSAISCIGDGGTPVDWFIVIKKVGSNGYVYMDNRMNNFAASRYSLSSNTTGAVARTINAAMAGSFLFFNAHSPKGGHPQPGSVYSHSAGVIGVDADGKSALYMPHSEVYWPNAKGSYTGLSGGLGSTFMCFTLDRENMESMASTFLVNNAKCYRRALAPSVAASFPILYKTANGYHTQQAGPKIRYQKTKGGLNITTFVKESRTGSDFYAVNLAPYYNADLFCATWLRGNGVVRPPVCKPPGFPYNVWNVASFRVGGAAQSNSWDHSKLVFIPDKGVFCIGDVNRMSGVQEPGRVHCVPLPAMVRSVAATISYNRSGCNSVTVPRTTDPYADDATVDPAPELSQDEKALFSRDWQKKLGM